MGKPSKNKVDVSPTVKSTFQDDHGRRLSFEYHKDVGTMEEEGGKRVRLPESFFMPHQIEATFFRLFREFDIEECSCAGAWLEVCYEAVRAARMRVCRVVLTKKGSYRTIRHSNPKFPPEPLRRR